MDVVAPDGAILCSKTMAISEKVWRNTYSATHVIFHLAVPQPPANSAVRLFRMTPEGKRTPWDAAIYLDNPNWTPAASTFLPALSKFVKYEKFFEKGTKWPEDLSKLQIVQRQRKTKTPAEAIAQLSNPEAEPSVTFEPAKAEVAQALKSFYVVPVYEWQHCYSHIGMGDEMGEILLPGGPRMQWMIRPGGLAAVVYPDGGIVYLARELTTLRNR
jgi:hypothetical protein